MADSSEGFFRTGPGKVTAYILIATSISVATYFVFQAIRGGQVVAQGNDRIFLDTATNKAFHVRLDDLVGQSIPIKSPYSGTNTGYPAELCYWTADGSVKSDPTPVVLNNLLGKSGPTFCPDCGRLVIGNNPKPGPTSKPPPTQAEWEQRHKSN
jgi:hypothetical protein